MRSATEPSAVRPAARGSAFAPRPGEPIELVHHFAIGVRRPEFDNVRDVRDLLKLHATLREPQPVLIRAMAGTGKTWFSRQLVYNLADPPPLRAADMDVPNVNMRAASRDSVWMCPSEGCRGHGTPATWSV